MRRFLMASSAALLGGCMTIPGVSTVQMVNTDPQGVLLTIDGKGECETPCTVKLDGPQKARLAKAGFQTITVTLAPGKSEVTIPMQLAAASTGVDSTELPELD